MLLKPITLCTSALLLTACQHAQNSPVLLPKTLVALGIDISTSTNGYYALTPGHVDSLYAQIARQGGGELYVVLIQENSALQQPLHGIIAPNQPDILEEGIPTRREKIRLENERRRAVQEQHKAQFMNALAPILHLSPTEPYTDINGALTIIGTILNSPRFNSFHKQVILMTDGKQSLRQSMSAPIQAVTLKAQGIQLVRPLNNELEQALGHTTPVFTHTTLDDAIKSL